jgi:hypothetical protein
MLKNHALEIAVRCTLFVIISLFLKSLIFRFVMLLFFIFLQSQRRGGRVVDRGGLENR